MRLTRQVFLGLIYFVIILATAPARAESDAAVAERILGPRWKQLSRRAGIVFAGTVLGGAPPNTRTDSGVPSITLRFRVDRAIAGVEPNQVLAIHEWLGASSRQKPMRPGERFLLFLYAPSHLGLTSPVGGPQGQIQLDATDATVTDPPVAAPTPTKNEAQSGGSPPAHASSGAGLRPTTLDQLERAIRLAREE